MIYHGNSLVSVNSLPLKTVFPYLLYVGNRERYKNFTWLLPAIAPLLQQRNVALICAGGGAFNLEEQMLIQSLHIGAYVKQQPIDCDRMLQQLYQSAQAFLFPSLYEGFGIPILEAFACRCACVLSNTSSLPEIAGEAAIYFHPESNESIINAVEQVISNDTLRNQLINAGSQRISNFSWFNTVSNTLAVYKKCLSV